MGKNVQCLYVLGQAALGGDFGAFSRTQNFFRGRSFTDFEKKNKTTFCHTPMFSDECCRFQSMFQSLIRNQHPFHEFLCIISPFHSFYLCDKRDVSTFLFDVCGLFVDG